MVHSEDEADEQPTTEADPAVVADGGETEIRDAREVRHSEDKVRYVNNPDGTLYAYREDGEHVVVSRGNEPATRWTKRVPAERTAVVPGQQFWTIPDNWDQRVRINGANTSFAIYHIPETGVDVLVTNPDNCHLVDKWYSVKRVGQLEVTYDDSCDWGELEHAIDSARDTDFVSEDVVEAMERLHSRSDLFERKLAEAVDEWAEEALFERRAAGEVVTLDGWTTDPWGDIFETDDLVADVTHADGETLDGLLEELSHVNVIPHYPEVRVDVAGGEGLPEDYYLRGLIQAGCSPAAAVDYLMTELRDRSQGDWSDERGTSQPSVSGNVTEAKRTLQA